MAVPKYSEMYNSVLTSLIDERLHSLEEVRQFVASDLKLTEEDLSERLQSGQTVFANRFGWSRTYLKKAGLIATTKDNQTEITSEGLKAVKSQQKIDNEYLNQYDSFVEFRTAKKKNVEQEDTKLLPNETPQDVIESAIDEVNASLEEELLAETLSKSSEFFEWVVVELLKKMGYGSDLENSGQVTGKSGDEGIDGIVSEDRLGFNSIYIQAKRWDIDRTVGRPEIQKFLGALAGQGASKGLFITTASFTKEAREFANKNLSQKIVLIDGSTFAQLMLEYNLGVSTVTTYAIKRLDSDFFE